MTESSGIVTLSSPNDPVELIAETVGPAIHDVELRIVDANGRDLPAGQDGEILVRCDRALIGYFDDPEMTGSVLTSDGWLRTGDIGSLDASGYLRVTDRLKDMFIVGGFNVYPAEIERKLGAYPGISQCALVGVPHPRLGEIGHAFVIRSPGSSVTEAELIAWCKANLSTYKVPRGVSFVDSLPVNATGKVMKFELRRLLENSAA
jgi:acyl-CoA synthetase (AMP-forming)/AMP-acid ligase II